METLNSLLEANSSTNWLNRVCLQFILYNGLMYLIIVQSLSDIKKIVEATEELLIRLSQDRAIFTEDFSSEKHNIGKHCSFNKRNNF